MKAVYILIACICWWLPASAQADTPYIATDVHYYNADSSIRFGGTLTLPQGGENCPAVVLVSGTGRQDRDGTMAGHKMFRVMADYLGRHGIGVLRVDDRGVGTSTGNYAEATTADFAADALASLQWLRRHKGVNPHAVGLIGHSEGGAAAYMAAAASREVAFVISLAGLATPGLQALKQQNRALVNSASIPAQKKYRYNSVNDLMFDTVYTYAQSPDLEQHIRSAFAVWQRQDSLYLLHHPPDPDDKGRFFFPLESYIHVATGPWYRYHIRFDPAPWLEKVQAPILAVNGDKDLMVDAAQNLENFRKYTSRNKDVMIVKVPGLNHLFQHCITCTREEPATLKEDMAPGVLEMIVEWIRKQVVSPPVLPRSAPAHATHPSRQ